MRCFLDSPNLFALPIINTANPNLRIASYWQSGRTDERLHQRINCVILSQNSAIDVGFTPCLDYAIYRLGTVSIRGGPLQCSECGQNYADNLARCPLCGTFNTGPLSTAGRGAGQNRDAVRNQAQQAVTTAPSKSMNALDAIYTQCAWQRPDGRWLNSKEMAEMEELARQYSSIKSGKGSWLTGLFKGAGASEQRIASIRAKVDAMGIPFGVFQAYANSLNR